MNLEEYQNQRNQQCKLLDTDENSIQEIIKKLPNKRFYEYSFHKLYEYKAGEVVDYKNWNDWKEWTYSPSDTLRIKYILLDNQKHIKDKNVIDFACHLGYLSLTSLHIGANHIKLTNIRKFPLEIAEEIINIAGYDNSRYEIFLSDLSDIDDNINLTNNVDTVLLCGVLYHIRDHYRILESIIHNSPNCIIIETLENDITLNTPEPIIHWVKENGIDELSGYDKNFIEGGIMVGLPSKNWTIMTMNHFGYNLESCKTFPLYIDSDIEPVMRTVSVFVKNDGE